MLLPQGLGSNELDVVIPGFVGPFLMIGGLVLLVILELVQHKRGKKNLGVGWLVIGWLVSVSMLLHFL